ncbi:fat-like cadherin-related tumor suppressor homolog [Centruroides sculpturatus]|uniref:fat-like cadherin-related tumor suppressor homolog n=1 Tax=Centruroides sculpturatus TaxID=218467 RepID=UPI000C6D1C4D|nr:fat-like cadherin-related tumor suppressor homolog [Centruroides sculpturatus]
MDREQHPRYNLKAHVQDQNRPDWECTSQVEILLGDVNDNAPVFTEEIYSIAVLEDSEVGTLVTKVHATDKDIGYNRKITYSFVDSAHEHFAVDKITGIVQLKKPLDREEKAMYNLTIQAEDHGTPQLSTSATLLVMVQDVNDNPPEFTQRFYFATVSEISTPGTKVIRVAATSRDSGINAEISYSLIDGNGLVDFTIHPKSGIISVAKSLDYETVHEYMLIIQAMDGGTPPLYGQTTVNITVIDENDNSPVFMQSSYSAVIREDAIVGDKIIQVCFISKIIYFCRKVLFWFINQHQYYTS